MLKWSLWDFRLIGRMFLDRNLLKRLKKPDIVWHFVLVSLLRTFKHINKDKRSFYEKEAEKAGWYIKELKRQISTSHISRIKNC